VNFLAFTLHLLVRRVIKKLKVETKGGAGLLVIFRQYFLKAVAMSSLTLWLCSLRSTLKIISSLSPVKIFHFTHFQKKQL
jgi:hypothetical protein